MTGIVRNQQDLSVNEMFKWDVLLAGSVIVVRLFTTTSICIGDFFTPHISSLQTN